MKATRISSFLALLPALVCVSGVAAAQDGAPTSDSAEATQTKVVVITRVSGAGSDRAAGFVAHHVRRYFSEDARYRVASLAASLGDPASAAAENALDSAARLAVEGREAYDTLELDKAVEVLNAAVRQYDANVAYVRELADVAKALMLLGATHLLRGEQDRGRERLAQAVILFPEIEPDARVFNPSMRQVFSETKGRVLSGKRGSLVIESEPSGAEIYLDGKFLGVSPETVLEVAEGRHYLRAVKDGYKPFGIGVDIKGTVELTDSAVLALTKSFNDYDRLSDQIFAALNNGDDPSDIETVIGQLAMLLNTDNLFMSEVSIDGEQVRLLAAQFNLENRLRSKIREGHFVYDADGDSYGGRIQQFMDEEFGPPKEGPEGTGPGGMLWDGEGLAHAGSPNCPFGMSCSDFRDNMLIIGASVGVGLGAVGGALGFLAKQDNNSFKDTAQPDPKADELASGGKTKALIGDVLMGTGLAVALTGVGLYLFYYPEQTAEEILEAGSTGFEWNFAPTDGGGFFSGKLRF